MVDYGITPGGKIIMNNELLTDKLTKYFKQEISEKKGKDLDGDGDIDSDDYLAARNKAIKKAMKKEDKEEDYELKQDPDTKQFYRRPKLSDKDRVTLLKIKKLLDKEASKKALSKTEDVDIGHIDDEPDMIKQEVYEIAEYASKLYVLLNKLDNLNVEVDFPHWWQSKVTKARLYIGKATHYLAYELKQDAIDASLTEAKATCCGRCGRKHVKGTPCKKPYISKNSPRHCQNK